MLSPRLSECLECASISQLLADIDCKLLELAKNEYNNTVFSLNRNINAVAMNDLLNYKRILTYRICNSNYACAYPTNLIASRVKLLKYK